jgi:hypothetical protein
MKVNESQLFAAIGKASPFNQYRCSAIDGAAATYAIRQAFT